MSLTKASATRHRPACVMTAGFAAMASSLAVLVIVLSGCDSTAILPPPPPELDNSVEARRLDAKDDGSIAPESSRSADGASSGRTVRSVELILSGPPASDRLYFEQALRNGLAGARIPLRHIQPNPQKRVSPEDLARAIRTAVSRGVAGLVVEPSDDAVVVDALYDAVGRGAAVLLLDKSVPARGGKSIPRIEFIGFADVGRQVVAAALEIERNFNPAKPGRIVLLHHRSDDPYLERGYESLLKPCQASGKPLQILEFEGDADQAVAALQKALEANPDIGIVLADDMVGINAGFVIRVERLRSGLPRFVLAGYTPNDYRDVTFLDLVHAIGERSVRSYAEKATQAIRNLFEGKQVADVVEVPVVFHQSTPEPGQGEMKQPKIQKNPGAKR